MVSLPNRENRADGYKHNPSGADNKVTRLEHDFVLQMYLKSGELWEAVSETRTRWDVTPRHDLPQAPLYHPLMPPGLPYAPPSAKEERSKWFDDNDRWWEDLQVIANRVVPESYLVRTSRVGWGAFFSLCVACDPSVPGLLNFAKLGILEGLNPPVDIGDPV